MAKTKIVTFLLSEEEKQELDDYIKSRRMSTGENITKSSIFREAIFKYIRNGKPDNDPDDKQESLPENPTSDSSESPNNPFEGISID